MESNVTEHKGCRITVLKEERGYTAYLKHPAGPSSGAGYSMGESMGLGSFAEPGQALAAAKAAIDAGQVW